MTDVRAPCGLQVREGAHNGRLLEYAEATRASRITADCRGVAQT